MKIKDYMKPTTIIVIIAFLVIGLYALTEVNYFAYKNVAKHTPYIPLNER